MPSNAIRRAGWTAALLAALAIVAPCVLANPGASNKNPSIQQAAAELLDAVQAGNVIKYGGCRTNEYFAAMQAGKEPDLRPLFTKYGTREFVRELARQARPRNSEALTLFVLDLARGVILEQKGLVADMASETLDSPSELLRLTAARWYTPNWHFVPERIKKKAGDILLRRFTESKGEECWAEMYYIRTRDDIPLVRQIYEDYYRQFLPPVIDTPLEDDRRIRRLPQSLSQEEKDALRAMRMLRLLAEMGDRDAAEELEERDPQKVRDLRREEQWRKRRAEVEERMGHPVSLEADVAAYLDFRLRGDYVVMGPLYERYGKETWFKEAIRQAEGKKSEYLLSHLLGVGEDLQYACLRALAVKNLESNSDYMRRNAIEWCERNVDALSPAERERYGQVVRQCFATTDSQNRDWQIKRRVAMLAEAWPQAKFDARRSGDAPDRRLAPPLGLVAAAPLSDAVFTSPAVADGRVFVVDGSGTAWCLRADTLEPVWSRRTAGGRANCNNVSSPAVVDGFVHFGTMAGAYYVLDAATGRVVRAIRTGDPIFSAPVLGNGRVYMATLGGRVYALDPDGTVRWTWDFVRERLDFAADRWSGADWLRLRGRAGWREQFCCTRDIAMAGDLVVVPAGGTICWLRDRGDRADLAAVFTTDKREAPATLGLSVGDDGAVYRQWTRRDNEGRVEVLRLADGGVETGFVRGTETRHNLPGLLSFSSVSLRGRDVYRCRPQEGLALCRHTPNGKTEPMDGYPSVAPPVLAGEHAVFGGLDGRLYVVPLAGGGKTWSFATAFGKAITAPAAVCDGRIYFGCEDGYLYALGPGGTAPLPTADLALHEVRSPLTGPRTAVADDWSTSFGNPANTNASDQGLRPPFRMRWVRRFKGTVKHFSVCGGGRMVTHTAEGQVFAVEQETGRLLWRRHWPGVHVSYTSPVIHDGRVLVPQAGLETCRLRCLDAATGRLLWEAPFSGSPSWNRQQPPVIHQGLAIYAFSTGRYTAGTWLFEHQSTFGFPACHKPLVRAYDLETGKEAWTRDFSEFGSGGDDAGLCLMDGTLYYSCYFGGKGPTGVTAALEPATGRVLWSTTDYALHAGCTISAADGRLYLGGYNPVEGKVNRVWCLDARDGRLVWKSDAVNRAIHVVTVGERLLFTHAQYQHGYLLDRATGKVLRTLVPGYRCTRFTLSEPYLVGPNLTLFDLDRGGAPVTCGPALDVLVCVGAIPSNGRIFQTTNGAGLQACMVAGRETAVPPPWQMAGPVEDFSSFEGP